MTGIRPGLKGTPYLYTLNLSCPEERWDELLPYYQQAIESFRLVQPSQVSSKLYILHIGCRTEQHDT